MTGWSPLYQKILGSSVWSTPYHVRIAWISLLALADRNGIVNITGNGFARIANITLEEAEESLDMLSSPDHDTMHQNAQGRRIERVEGGWKIVNWEIYRLKAWSSAAREADAKRKALARQFKNVSETPTPTPTPTPTLTLTPSNSGQVQTCPDKSTMQRPADSSDASHPSLSEVLAYADQIGLAPWKAEDWWNEMEGGGWIDYAHRKIVSWKPVLARVRTKWEADGRPMTPPKAKHGQPKQPHRNDRIGSEESRAALRAQWAEADKRNGIDPD